MTELLVRLLNGRTVRVFSYWGTGNVCLSNSGKIIFSTLLYAHARDLRLSSVFYEPNEAAQLQALRDWLTAFGYCAVVNVAMLKESREAMLQAWKDVL